MIVHFGKPAAPIVTPIVFAGSGRPSRRRRPGIAFPRAPSRPCLLP
jgi:hypothetical protein